MNGQSPGASRRSFLAQLAVAGAMLAGRPAFASTAPAMTVWKDRNCGCCGGWVTHLRRNGFTVTVIETSDVNTVKAQRGVPAELVSCHTAEIAGYTVEGHVPADAIWRLLAEKKPGGGLAVPGMPMGSPGMEGGRPEPYTVMRFGVGVPTPFGRFVGSRPI